MDAWREPNLKKETMGVVVIDACSELLIDTDVLDSVC